MQINNPFTNLKLERNFMKQTYNIGLKNPDNSQSKNNWFIRLHYFLYAERKISKKYILRKIFLVCVRKTKINNISGFFCTVSNCADKLI